MLLEDDCRRQCGFETMRRSGANHAAKAAEGLAALLLVVRQGVEPCLDRTRRSQTRDQATLVRSQRERRRVDPVSAWERARQ